jgi:hypothetical protein
VNYYEIIFWVETHGVDAGSVACVLANVFALDYVSENDILVASPSNELGVVLADVERVDVIVMNIFIVLDHNISGWIVETDASVLRSSHTVLPVSIEFYGIDRTAMNLEQTLESCWQLVRVTFPYHSIIIIVLS